MSLTTPPSKILLTNTTKMSLNDRFTKLDKVRSETAPAAIALNASSIARQQASTKNRMLAVQMAQRPSVQAALKFKQNNLKNRLSGGAGVAPKRLGTNISPTKPANLARRLSGGNGGIVGGRGLAGRVQFKPRRASLPPNRQSPRVFTNSKIGMNRQKTLSGGKPGMMRNRPNQNPRPQKNNNNNNGQPIKKDLDMDLDEYMSKSKSHLNADLDAYMSKSKTHLDADLDTYMAQAPQ